PMIHSNSVDERDFISSVNSVTTCLYVQGRWERSVPQKQRCGPKASTTQRRVALGTLAELGHGSRRERHHRHIVTFRGLPEPIGCAVFQPLSRLARVKCHPDSKHIGLSFPRGHERAAFRLL